MDEGEDEVEEGERESGNDKMRMMVMRNPMKGPQGSWR